MGKLGNCLASVACCDNTLPSADEVRLHEDRLVCESKAARHSPPRILISCDTESIFLVTKCDGLSIGMCCRASKKLQVCVFFFFFLGKMLFFV